MGKLLYMAKENAGLYATDNALLYLILSVFGLDIVNYCLMQADLNDIAEVQ